MSAVFSAGNYFTRAANLPGTGAFTMCAWVKITTVTPAKWPTFVIADNTGNYTYLGCNVGTSVFRPDSNTGPLVSDDLGTNQWRFVAWTRLAGGGAQAIVGLPDGSLASLVTGSTNACAATRTDVGGSASFADNWLDGELAYVRIWTASLTYDELAAERRSTLAVRTANLVADWPFDTASGADASGNGNTLTAVGAPTSGTSPDVNVIVHVDSTDSGTILFGQTTDSLTFNSTPADGELILLAAYHSNTGLTDTVTTAAFTQLVNASTGDGQLTVHRRIASAEAGPTYAFSFSAGANNGVTFGMRYRGVDLSTPVEVIGTVANAASALTIPGLTTLTDKARHILLQAASDTLASITPAGYALELDGTNSRRFAYGKTISPIGATGDQNVSSNGTFAGRVGVGLALRLQQLTAEAGPVHLIHTGRRYRRALAAL